MEILFQMNPGFGNWLTKPLSGVVVIFAGDFRVDFVADAQQLPAIFVQAKFCWQENKRGNLKLKYRKTNTRKTQTGVENSFSVQYGQKTQILHKNLSQMFFQGSSATESIFFLGN